MKERPILFSGPMVRAILEGRKTQTRRVVKPPAAVITPAMAEGLCVKLGPLPAPAVPCPHGAPGDRLWVKETFNGNRPEADAVHPAEIVTYLADYPEKPPGSNWKPSIFMPSALSRITLEIVSVRVERVQEISGADARAEGIEATELGWRDYLNQGSEVLTGRHSFQTLWDSINAKRGFGWEVNPWVWVIEFRRVEP